MFRLSAQMGPNCILGRAGAGLASRPWREAPLSLQCDKVQDGEEEKRKEKEKGELGERVGRERENESTRLASHLLRGDASSGSETIMPDRAGRPRGGPGPAEWSSREGDEEGQTQQGRWRGPKGETET